MSRFTDLLPTSLDWMFWPSTRPRTDSAWLGHIPFAHWLVTVTNPRSIVELGTLSGSSYAAFCEAVSRNGYETKCFAVDTWSGDQHVGPMEESVYQSLSEFNRDRYAGFSTLLRMTFDEALEQFADDSIDLLHIDGTHTYEAVRHDFETWLPKLSPRAVVLFHDTAEMRDDFGVWQFWAEISARYPSFAFTHFHGLGVLQVGPEVTGPAKTLFELESDFDQQETRDRFEALGNNIKNLVYAIRLQREVKRLNDVIKAQAAATAS